MSAADTPPAVGEPLAKSTTVSSTTSSISGASSVPGPGAQPDLTKAISSGSVSSTGGHQASILGQCGRCKQSVLSTDSHVRCLVCSTSNVPDVITNVCSKCYLIGAYAAGHAHDKTFSVSDLDITVTDPRIPDSVWTVRRNARHVFWYQHVATGFKTHIRPLTAICGLPAGWAQVKDANGKLYYQNATGQLFLNHPNGLPLGWREAKDPDGKLFYVHDQLHLATWNHPGQQPPSPSRTSSIATPSPSTPASTFSQRPSIHGSLPSTSPTPTPTFSPRPSIHGSISSAASSSPTLVTGPQLQNVSTHNLVVRPSVATGQNIVVAKPQPSAQVLAAAKLSRTQRPVTLGTATEATVNLIDPSHGKIVRNTKIAAHITGKGIGNTVNAIANNKPLQDFARGTGIALANRKIKKAWKKAAKEVDLSDRRTQIEQAVKISRTDTHAQLVIEDTDSKYSGEYIVELDDGTVAVFSAQGKPVRVIKHGRAQSASLVASAAGVPMAAPVAQRPHIVHAATTGAIGVPQTHVVGRSASAQIPVRRPVSQAQMTPQQRQQMQMQGQIQHAAAVQLQAALQQQQQGSVPADGQQIVFSDPQYDAAGQDASFVNVQGATYGQSFDAQSPMTITDPNQAMYIDTSQTGFAGQSGTSQMVSFDPGQTTTFVDQNGYVVADPSQSISIQEGTFVEQDTYVGADGTVVSQSIEVDYDEVDVGGEPVEFDEEVDISSSVDVGDSFDLGDLF